MRSMDSNSEDASDVALISSNAYHFTTEVVNNILKAIRCAWVGGGALYGFRAPALTLFLSSSIDM